MSLLLKLIFICTCFYLLGMSTSLPRKSRKPKTTEKPEETSENPQETSENPQETTAKPKNLTKAEQLKKEKESRALNFDEHFYCIKNCTGNAFKSCDEASASNKNKDGPYLLDIVPNELEPFYAYCQHEEATSKNWILIQKRRDGSVDFYRDWFDYKYGFGLLFREFWMGLERIHEITNSKDYELWIYLMDFNGTSYHMHYSRFYVSSEADGYKLTVGGYKGIHRDAMKEHNGKKFNTFDNDVSDSTYNCPEKDRSGWWHVNCCEANLNGPYRPVSEKPGDWTHIFWRMQRGDIRLYYTHMAIRPN